MYINICIYILTRVCCKHVFMCTRICIYIYIFIYTYIYIYIYIYIYTYIYTYTTHVHAHMTTRHNWPLCVIYHLFTLSAIHKIGCVAHTSFAISLCSSTWTLLSCLSTCSRALIHTLSSPPSSHPALSSHPHCHQMHTPSSHAHTIMYRCKIADACVIALAYDYMIGALGYDYCIQDTRRNLQHVSYKMALQCEMTYKMALQSDVT